MTAGILSLCMLFSLLGTDAALAADDFVLIDIKGTEWYANEVLKMAEDGVISGFPDKTFRATQPISNVEFVTIVAKAVSAPVGESNGHWAGLTMQSALTAGWYTDAEIYPEVYDQPISRQQAAMILVCAFRDKLEKSSSLNPFFADGNTILPRFVPYVNEAYQCGLFKGDENGNFKPFGNLSRAEAAVLIYRATQEAVVTSPVETVDAYTVLKNTGLFTEPRDGALIPVDASVTGVKVVYNSIGGGVRIKMDQVSDGYSEASRAFVKDILMLLYPTSYEEAYVLVVKTLLDRVFERKSSAYPTAGVVRYMDNRPFYTSLISSGAKETVIAIGAVGDTANYELNSRLSSSFIGYSYREFTKENSELISQELIETYNISSEEYGE